MEQDSLSKLLNGVLLKKYSCINTVKVSYDSLHNNLYYVIVYVIPVNNQKGFSDCNRDYPEIKQGQEANDLTEFYHKLHTYKYNKTICLDETSIYLNMTLSYGRSKSGSRVIKKTHKYPYKRNIRCASNVKLYKIKKRYPEIKTLQCDGRRIPLKNNSVSR